MYNKYTPTYLYVKYHKLTGLKYFGKTTQNPFTYLGSGTRWTRHIKKHGTEHVDTLWVQLFSDKNELINFATSFSVENNIVESSEWANLCIENGLDGGPRENSYITEFNKRPRSKAHGAAISKALAGKSRPHTKKRVIINNVEYASMLEAAAAYDRTYHTIYTWVKQGKAVIAG